jgi:two-component system sensor histidine kinase TctE
MTSAAHAPSAILRLFRGGRRRSVFDRLRVVLGGVFVGGSAAALAAAWFFANTAANEAYDSLLISAAVQIAETLNVEDSRLSVSPPDAAFETLALARNDRLFYAVRDPRGRLLTGYPGLTSNVATAAREQPQISDARFAGAAVRSVTLGRYISTPEGGGWCSIVVAQTREARHVLAWTLMAKTGSLVIFVGGLGYFASLAAARRALLPLTRIEQALAVRDAQDVTPLEVDSPRETQALVDAINLVMARFADRMAKLHTFVAIAAHQIRTPLAALTAQVELLEGPEQEASRRARIGRIRNRVSELGRLTNQLLGHAMIVYRADTVPHAPVDLTELARAALSDGVPLSLERDLTVTFDAPRSPVIVRGDPVSLREGLTNLIHNAAMHGAATRLAVQVGADEGQAWVCVRDDGPGIPRAQWDVVLTPFAMARSEAPGAGLGLSIAHEIARSHQGKLIFNDEDPCDFAVRMVLPRAEDA